MNNIIILGGGSAGWMTASYLIAKNPNLNITVIESPNIKTIGVGEATTPYLMKFFRDIGVKDESEWMPHCDATYKNGVMYEDWDFINSRFWHSFEVDEDKYKYWNINREEQGFDKQDYWTSTMRNGHIAMRDNGKWLADKDGQIPEWYHTKSYNGWPQHWAYHIDADKFGVFLRERTKGINHIQAEIEDVIVNDDGIEKLIDTDGKEYTADLFVDCTGFKRFLIDKVNPEFKSFEPYLTHNKACVIRYPYIDEENEMRPRTRSKCLSSGWFWEIPLYNRISAGYVYTSDYLTDEEAENELRNAIGYDRTEGCKSFTVDIKSGFYDKPWTQNVVAIGLSAGFIEPLESTLLFAIQVAGMRLFDVTTGELTIDEYNQKATSNIEDFLDYISIGYNLSHRQDSKFWRDRTNSHITPRMEEWLSLCKEEMQPPPKKKLFVPSSWISKAIGFGVFPKNAMFKDYSKEEHKKVDDEISKYREFDHTNLLSQKEYLDKFIYNNEEILS